MYYSTSDTWSTWTTCSTTSSATCDQSWTVWSGTDTSTSCTTSCATTSTVWYIWSTKYVTQPVIANYDNNIYRQRQEEIRQQEEESRKKKEEAEIKAKELLLDLIGKDQMDIYEKTGRLLVHGSNSDYLIQKEGYVKKIEKDKVVDLCIHLKEKFNVPKTDNVIALALLATADEYEFEKLANKHGSLDKKNWEMPIAANFG